MLRACCSAVISTVVSEYFPSCLMFVGTSLLVVPFSPSLPLGFKHTAGHEGGRGGGTGGGDVRVRVRGRQKEQTEQGEDMGKTSTV